MFNFELYRIIEAERQRDLERTIRHRRLLRLLAIRPAPPETDDTRLADRDHRTAAPCAQELGPAR